MKVEMEITQQADLVWLAKGEGPMRTILAYGPTRVDAQRFWVEAFAKQQEEYAECEAQSAKAAEADGDYGQSYEDV